MPLTKNNQTEADLNIIYPDPDQPRMQCKKAAINEIAISAKKHGIINAITVRAHPTADDKWMIVHGETRWRAAKNAGLKTIPARLATPDETHDHVVRIMLQAADNLSSPLSPIDWGHMYSTLKKSGMNAKQIEEKMIEHGLHRHGQSAIKNLTRIAEGSPEWMLSLIESDVITTTHAKIMLNLEKEILAEIREWLKTNHRPSVAELEAEVLDLYTDKYPAMHDPEPFSCTGCRRKKSILKNEFCLDQKCFAEKSKKDMAGATSPQNEPDELPQETAQSEPPTVTTHTITPPPCWNDKNDAADDLKTAIVQWIIKQLEIHFKNHPFDAYSFLNWSHIGCPIVKKGKITFRKPLFVPEDFELKNNLTLATTPATNGVQQTIAIALIQKLSCWTSCQRTADIGRELMKNYDVKFCEKTNALDIPINTTHTDVAWAWDQLTGADQ